MFVKYFAYICKMLTFIKKIALLFIFYKQIICLILIASNYENEERD